MTGHARQEPYRPFTNPDRAASEEFGEVVAVGLHYLARSGHPAIDADDEYWREFLETRARLLSDLGERLRLATSEPGVTQQITSALDCSRQTLAAIRARHCTEYVKAWLQDREDWTRYINRLPSSLSLEDAFTELDLAALR
jgi:hypothetical protein